jgi:hypothetical protein
MKSMLREYVRELLTEAAKGPKDLPDGVFVRIDLTDAGTYEIYYADEEGYYIEGKQNPVRGLIEIQEADEPCGGAFIVLDSGAAKGWGPLLYDVAMEFATQLGGGLASGRNSVSLRARDVWDYYAEKRADVTGIQMDDLDNTLTPTRDDNCGQTSAYKSEELADIEWHESPLSKRWTKKLDTIEKLRSMGKLIE